MLYMYFFLMSRRTIKKTRACLVYCESGEETKDLFRIQKVTDAFKNTKREFYNSVVCMHLNVACPSELIQNYSISLNTGVNYA